MAESGELLRANQELEENLRTVVDRHQDSLAEMQMMHSEKISQMEMEMHNLRLRCTTLEQHVEDATAKVEDKESMLRIARAGISAPDQEGAAVDGPATDWADERDALHQEQVRMQMVIATAAKERAALQLTLDTTVSDHTALVTRLQREVKGYKVKMAALEDDAAALESTEAMNASLNKRVAELETVVMAATASAASSSAAGGAASATSQAELTKITQEKAELESAMQRLPALELKITALETQLSEKDTTIKTLNTAAKAFATAQQVLQKKLDQADKSIANGMAAVKTGTDVTKRVKREKSELFQKMDFETKAHKTTQQKLHVLERNSAAVDQFREDAMRAKADAAAVQAELEQATSRVAEMEAQVIKATSAAANGGGSGTQQSVIGFVCGSVAAIAVQMVVAANSEE